MRLKGKKVLIFVGPYFEDLEFWYPKIRLEEEGAEITVAGLGEKMYRGKKGLTAETDGPAEKFVNEVFDAVLIPGGWGPDKLRLNSAVLEIVRKADAANKVVASICHGGWVLISAGVVEGRKVTGYISTKDDLLNAGAIYQDAPVVVDNNLITARVPADLPYFCRAVVETLEKSNT